jgi:membrane-associated phospholipid phosphatase
VTTRSNSSHLSRNRVLYEVLFIVGGYIVYTSIRGMAGDRVFDAFANAYALIDIERDLGIFKEVSLQRWIGLNGPLVDFFNIVYFWFFFPVLIPTAIALYIFRPEIYRLARNAFLISGGIAAIFFVTLPTAPPRFFGHLGFIDTLNDGLAPSYSSIPWVNPYAALPSMHVGWTFLLGTALFLAFRGWRFRPVFFVLPVLMFTATVATGNHYFLDGMLGLVVAATGLRIALLIQQREAEVPTAQLEAPSSS